MKIYLTSALKHIEDARRELRTVSAWYEERFPNNSHPTVRAITSALRSLNSAELECELPETLPDPSAPIGPYKVKKPRKKVVK